MDNLRVMLPGVVQSFDPNKGATVQLSVSQTVTINGQSTTTAFPILQNLPYHILGAGGFSVTLPVKQGDECFVMFADLAIDTWFQSGGSNNPQAFIRKHDLSNGIAIFGLRSQPRKLASYAPNSLQIRSDDGQTVIDVAGNAVTVTTQTVTVNATNATVKASSTAEIDAATANVKASGAATVQGSSVTLNGSSVTIGNLTTIDGKPFLAHTHSGVQTGAGVSGPPV